MAKISQDWHILWFTLSSPILTYVRHYAAQSTLPLWKFVPENHTENFGTLKITLKNNIIEGLTENYTEKSTCYSGMQKNR